ncbi:FUSC family protein [Anaerovorax odorimutans]|uniref:FUSC family protein n=1 Tax=Anaerovorax odorimutans TaxID=109327 RepID=A0ABT1RP12_9FIRM|nr:FUSC family protein [Anaerovorax odorimutans]MCQ4636929.1 FUSC family protein [Anaerovorax odorimutans]
MKFYDVMQLNAADTKRLLRETQAKREKRIYKCAFVLKNILCIFFCMAVVVSFSLIFGQENSIPGVIVLIAILTIRKADLDIDSRHGLVVIPILFAILAAGPHLAGLVGPAAALGINLVSILSILVLSCHNIYLYNHATFVLGYLMLMGYDVSGDAYIRRVLALMTGAVLVSIVFYINHRKKEFPQGIGGLFRDFFTLNERTRWQIKMALGLSLGMFIASLLGIPRVMWMGFACMSLLPPVQETVPSRVKQRIIGVIGGCALFAVLYQILPGDPGAYMGILGGLAVGFSGTYSWQTVFNCLGALSMAVGIFGLPGAIALRIINNFLGALYSFCFHKLYEGGTTLLLREKDASDIAQ